MLRLSRTMLTLFTLALLMLATPAQYALAQATWVPYALTTDQTAIIVLRDQGSTTIRVRFRFPNTGYRVTFPASATLNTFTGRDYSINVAAERYTGFSAQAITSVSSAFLWRPLSIL